MIPEAKSGFIKGTVYGPNMPYIYLEEAQSSSGRANLYFNGIVVSMLKLNLGKRFNQIKRSSILTDRNQVCCLVRT